MEEEYEVSVKHKKEKKVEEKTPEEKKPDAESDTKSEDSASTTSTDSENSDATSTDSTDKKSEEPEISKEEETETRMEKRSRKHTYKLDIKRSGKSHKAYSESKTLMAEGRSVLKIFKEYEQNKLRTAESKNRLETLLYSIPSVTEDESIMAFGTEKEAEDLKQAAKDLDDWFFEDEAYTADWKVFDRKYKDLNGRMKSLRFRKEESEGRDELLSIFSVRANQSSKNISQMSTSRPWISQEKLDAAQKKIEEIVEFIEGKAKEQREMGLQEDPVLLSSVLKQKTDDVKNEYERLRLIRKPVEKKEKKEEKTEENKPEEGNTGDAKIDPSNFKMDETMFKDGKIDQDAFKKMYDDMMKDGKFTEEDMKKAFNGEEKNSDNSETKEDQKPDDQAENSDDTSQANTEKTATADL